MNYWGLGFEQAFEAYLSRNRRRKIRPHPYHENTEEQRDMNLKESLITQLEPTMGIPETRFFRCMHAM